MIPLRRKSRQTRQLLLGFAVVLILFYVLFLEPSNKDTESIRLSHYMNDDPPVVDVVKSSIDWGKIDLVYPQPPKPPGGNTALPRHRSPSFPKIQYSFGPQSKAEIEKKRSRRQVVRDVFEKDWQHYRAHAWMKDAVNPISGTAKDQFSGWAATLVDSLDTLWIMGLRAEFDEAVEAVAKIDFGQSSTSRVNMFESTIRYLGGLLAAYDLSKRNVLLTKAIEIGDLLYGAFNTPNHMPVDFISFNQAKTGQGLTVEAWVVSASPGTLSLEMTRLSQVTGDMKYYDAVTGVMEVFRDQQSKTHLPGLWPIWVSMRDKNVSARREFTIGGSADSLFEYLPKMYALLGGSSPMYETMTKDFLKTANEVMFFRPMLPDEADILISGNVKVSEEGKVIFDPESEHLTCFIGGTVSLAGRIFNKPEEVETGKKLAHGCAYAYNAFPSGMMPERYNMVPCSSARADVCKWDEALYVRECDKRQEYKPHLPKGFTTAKDPRYLLRPEAIESVFINYRITGDPAWQDIAWTMFKAVAKGTAAQYGHASVKDVTLATEELPKEDYMESFWLAETLKYFYLVFSPSDLISLDEYVLNTEAHPFRMPERM